MCVSERMWPSVTAFMCECARARSQLRSNALTQIDTFVSCVSRSFDRVIDDHPVVLLKKEAEEDEEKRNETQRMRQEQHKKYVRCIQPKFYEIEAGIETNKRSWCKKTVTTTNPKTHNHNNKVGLEKKKQTHKMYIWNNKTRISPVSVDIKSVLTCARESRSLSRSVCRFLYLVLLNSPKCTTDFLFVFCFLYFTISIHCSCIVCVSMVDDITVLFLFLCLVLLLFACAIPFHYFHFVWFHFICCNNQITTISFPFFHNIFVSVCFYITYTVFFSILWFVAFAQLHFAHCAHSLCVVVLFFFSLP